MQSSIGDQLMNCEASMRVNCEAELTLSIDKVASAVGLSRRNTESDLGYYDSHCCVRCLSVIAATDLLERIERHCRFVLSPSPGEAPTDGSSITLDSFPLGFDTTSEHGRSLL